MFSQAKGPLPIMKGTTMNTKRRLRIAGLALTLLFTIACGAAPTVLQAPSTPTPGPGMGVPHGSGGWQISLQTVRTADSLQMGSYPNQTTFTPKDGYAFLI